MLATASLLSYQEAVVPPSLNAKKPDGIELPQAAVQYKFQQSDAIFFISSQQVETQKCLGGIQELAVGYFQLISV